MDKPGRQRFWLSAFALIGYSERILLPVIVWLAVVVGAGLAYALVVGVPFGIASGEFVELLGRFVAGPLAVLRIEVRPPNSTGPWDTVIWGIAQLLGTICLGAALFAVRKVTRAAHYRGSPVPVTGTDGAPTASLGCTASALSPGSASLCKSCRMVVRAWWSCRGGMLIMLIQPAEQP